MVYISSLVVGGLHHHEHSEHSIHHSDRWSSRLATATIQLSPLNISNHEDADGCTLCTALHQAKALPIVISPTSEIALAGEAGNLPVEFLIASIPFIHQARAPPPFMS
jgi:hypothetical protein